MYRRAAFVSLFAVITVFQLSHAAEVNVRDKDNKLCLYANLMVNFSVSYDTADNKSATAEFELPADVNTDGSACDTTSSTLKLNFGDGHSWSVNFTLSEKVYQADTVSFSYNLGDKTVFPNSASNDTTTVAVKPGFADVAMDTCYSCKSRDTLESTSVNQTLWNVLIQAFVSDNSTSANITSCAADTPTTPVAPTTHTTGPPTTAPVTNTTTTATPTTTPTPTLPTPETGKYSFKSDENGTACLMAYFGLRISYKQEEMNFDPNNTAINGSCGVNSSELVVVSSTQQMTIRLTFTNDTKKFRLHALNITGNTSAGVPFSEANTNLSLWEAAVGSSYMCNKEQNYTVTNLLTIYTFNLQVQPFGVKKGVFSTAEECFLDSDLSFLVPIAVGVALSFLIILVLISYLIGRRKSRTGYQSV